MTEKRKYIFMFLEINSESQGLKSLRNNFLKIDGFIGLDMQYSHLNHGDFPGNGQHDLQMTQHERFYRYQMTN